MTYQQFRSGWTFRAVANMLWDNARREYERTGRYIPPRRNYILTTWRKLKLEAWERYQHGETES